MDQQALSKLDPKLQETYHRVMGVHKTLTERPADPIGSTPLASVHPGVQSKSVLPGVVNKKLVGGKTGNLASILFVVGGILFFLVYTFVWMNIFNFKLPF